MERLPHQPIKESPHSQSGAGSTRAVRRSWPRLSAVSTLFAVRGRVTDDVATRQLFVECGVVISLFFGLWMYLTKHAGGPISLDEFWYIEASLNSKAYPEELNRYFHIYLQKLFFALTGHPVLGVKLFWAFEIALVSVMIYGSVKLLSGRSGYLGAYTAVLFFFSQPLIFEFAGVTYADFTAMLMVTLGAVLFLLIETRKIRRSFLLIMLGLTFFCAVKSKETGICLIPILWGSLWYSNEEKKWNRAARDAGLIVTGLTIGLGGFMLLDHIFLGDALWGWRTANIHRLVSFNISEIKRGTKNWYDQLFTKVDIAPAMLLSLLSFGSAENERDKSVVRYLWLVPLALVIFLTNTMIRAHWGVEPRYFIPAIPIVAILAGHTINTRSNWCVGAIRSSLFLGFASAAAILTVLLIEKSVADFGWQRDSFFRAISYPVELSLLLYLLVWVREWNTGKRFLLSFCLVSLVMFPLAYTERTIRLRVTADRSAQRYYPYAMFAERIVFSPDMKIFVSKNLISQYGMLHQDNSICRGLFNWFFKQAAKDEQFVIADPQVALSDGNFTYIFLTAEDWNMMGEVVQSGPIGKAIESGEYVAEMDQQSKVMFVGKTLSLDNAHGGRSGRDEAIQ